MTYYDHYLLTNYKQDLFVRNKVSFSANALPSPNISQACAFKRREGTAITMHCRQFIAATDLYQLSSTDCVVLCTHSTLRRACGGGKPSPQDHCGISSRKSYENRIAKLALKLCGC